jgi:hypothetical protein
LSSMPRLCRQLCSCSITLSPKSPIAAAAAYVACDLVCCCRFVEHAKVMPSSVQLQYHVEHDEPHCCYCCCCCSSLFRCCRFVEHAKAVSPKVQLQYHVEPKEPHCWCVIGMPHLLVKSLPVLVPFFAKAAAAAAPAAAR